MLDREGDPTYRVIPADTEKENYVITHDYYEHSDADKDVNVVFPIDRLKELEESGEIGEVAESHYGFMGHIDGAHVGTLLTKTAVEVSERLASEEVDLVVLTPG